MYEHTSFTYDTIIADQKRIDRANELRRIIAENPGRIVPREPRFLSAVRGWFRTGHADAETAAPAASGSPRVICDQNAQPAHAR